MLNNSFHLSLEVISIKCQSQGSENKSYFCTFHYGHAPVYITMIQNYKFQKLFLDHFLFKLLNVLNVELEFSKWNVPAVNYRPLKTRPN